jgi:uncharacterized protein YjdB
MMKKNKVACFALCALLLVGSGVMMSSCNNETVTPDPDDGKDEVVKVTEVALTLSKTNAKVGDTVTVTTTIRPSNATDKSVTLSSSDTTIATIEDGKIVCKAAGKVTITARSNQVTTKKGTAELVVLGTDSEGRAENIFEAEKGNLIDDSTDGLAAMKAEATDDDRVSGGSVVGSIKKNDRVIWGINASAADETANLHFSLMGPSGWGGNWGNISYNFSDYFTVKVNGKNVDTSEINVAGSTELSSSSDYYNIKDVEIGNVALKEGLNVVTFVLSNRYDITRVSDSVFNGAISTYCNLDKMTIWSKADLTYVADTVEVEGADADVLYTSNLLEAEAATTRVYESESSPDVDLTGKTMAEFKQSMNVIFGVRTTAITKAKLAFKIAAPYVDETTAMTDVALSKILTLNIGGKTISVDGLTLKGNGSTGSKENFTTITTDWMDIPSGDNIISLVVNPVITGYAYLGGLDSLDVMTIGQTIEAYKVEKPILKKTVKLEAEADTTKRVGFADLADGATSVEMVKPTLVETDKYVSKNLTAKLIYGIEAEADSYATITIKYAAPYKNTTEVYKEVGIGSLGDLWVNGTIISTPNKLKSTTAGSKENWNVVTIETQVELHAGKNRIAWEPTDYTGDNLEFMGAIDYIEVESTTDVTPYEVNMWTDRNTYFDSTGNEPINVTVDAVSATSPNSCWVGLWHGDEEVETNCKGSLYWYYPTNSAYNTDATAYLGTACDITKQNPNSERHLIDGKNKGEGEYSNNDGNGYGSFRIVYMEADGKNSTGGYTITDEVYISVWNDVDNNYGGLVK